MKLKQPSFSKAKTADNFDPTIITAEVANPDNEDFYMLESFSIDLVEKEKCKEILGDHDIVLFTFVGHNQKT